MKLKEKRVEIFHTPVDSLTMDETVNLIRETILSGDQIIHTCINANKVVLMENDEELRTSVAEADIISADGQAIVWASQLFNKPIPERVPGIDLMDQVVKMAFENNFKVFFLGAKEEIVKKVVDIYSENYNPELIGGYRNGYFKDEDQEGIAKQINESGAQILLVAVPSPKKENFIHQYRNQMDNIKFMMGVGGTFDVVSGKVKRAPKWMQNNGLEWLYRLYMEPKKMWRRYLIGNFKFIFITVKEISRKGNTNDKVG